MSKSYETIKVEREQSTLWIILNRQHRLNAFNDVLLEELADMLETAEKDPSNSEESQQDAERRQTYA